MNNEIKSNLKECLSCNGTGSIKCDCMENNSSTSTCITCVGEGKFVCPVCDGEGRF